MIVFFKGQLQILQDTWGDYWTVGIHPKVGQFERTLISIFNPDIIPTISKHEC